MKTVYEDMTEDAEIVMEAIRKGMIVPECRMAVDKILKRRDALAAHIAMMDAKEWNAYLEADDGEEA